MIQINKYNTHENIKRAEYDYQVKDKDYKAANKVMLVNDTVSDMKRHIYFNLR